MAFGPSDTLSEAVLSAFSQGGDFSSYFGAALSTAAANLLALGPEAAAVPTALAAVGAQGARQPDGWPQQAGGHGGACSPSGCCRLPAAAAAPRWPTKTEPHPGTNESLPSPAAHPGHV